MTGKELAEMALKIAKRKTIYVMGCFGAPMTASNKLRYIDHHSYNRLPDREQAIKNADDYTFGFDCVGLIKGILWGFNFETPSFYGGAEYGSNGLPDIDANRMLDICKDISADFSCIQIGEVVGMEDHIGIYVGDGKAVECTPRWEDGVQITAVHNIGRISDMGGRSWVRHGKLPWVTYKADIPPSDNSQVEFIKSVQGLTGSVVDGVAGPQTISNTITLARWKNGRHPLVRTVQERLAALGYEEVGQADGIAGPAFEQAVKHYQEDHGCYVDGVITAKNKTWRRLLGMEG